MTPSVASLNNGMTANARIPIDLNDPKIPLTEGLKTLLEFTAVAGQKTFQDNKRETQHVKHILYVPRAFFSY